MGECHTLGFGDENPPHKSKLEIGYADQTYQTIKADDPQGIDRVEVGATDVFTVYGNEWIHSSKN